MIAKLKFEQRRKSDQDLSQAVVDDALIERLGIVANSASASSHVAAAVLDDAIQLCKEFDRKSIAERLQLELKERYSHTFHGRKLSAKIRQSKRLGNTE